MSSGKVSRPTLDEIAAEFPEALERFDWSCPSIAATGRAEFLVRRKTLGNMVVRSQLIAQAEATFDEVPSPAVPSIIRATGGLPSSRKRFRHREWWYQTAGGYACTPWRELRAYWEPKAMVWRRLTWVRPALRAIDLMPIGTPVAYLNDGSLIRGKADDLSTARIVGLTSVATAPGVSDSDTMLTTEQGDVICAAGLITMTTAQWDEICGTMGGLSCVPYYLDASTAGRLTDTPPMLSGQVVQQVIVGVSPTTAKVDISAPMVMM